MQGSLQNLLLATSAYAADAPYEYYHDQPTGEPKESCIDERTKRPFFWLRHVGFV